MKRLILLFVFFLCLTGIIRAQSVKEERIADFAARTEAYATINKATGSVGFIRFKPGRSFLSRGNSPEEKSFAFLAENPELFGFRQGIDEHRLKSSEKDSYGNSHVTLQQTHRGVPVFDGVMKFHFKGDASLTSVNGNFIPDIRVSAIPSISEAAAGQNAMKYVSGSFGALDVIEGLSIHKSTLYIYQKGLLEGYRGQEHLVYEVEVRRNPDIREFVYIDAHTGLRVDQFTGIHHSIDRKVYEGRLSANKLIWQEGDDLPDDIWIESEIESARHIYNLFNRTFGYKSYDGAGATMITTHDNPDIFCPNANWNGVSANYCTQTASDDVVAHEWAHAYTEYTSGLIYAFQAGSLNESFSDVWGEVVDQLNHPYFDDGENNDAPTGCSTTNRWQMGEGASAFGGAIRNMMFPNCHNQPARVGDPIYYCAAFANNSTNNGGVHRNSGVPNHAFALLVDGGTYNGKTIAPIGMTKAVHLWWRVQSAYLTKTSNFNVFADALLAAAEDLLGLPLSEISIADGLATGPSGEVFTLNDIESVQNAIDATELNLPTNCNFDPLLAAVEPVCAGGEPQRAIFFAGFEEGNDGFTFSSESTSSTWFPRDWVRTENAAGRNSYVMYGVNYRGGNCGDNNQAGIIRLQSPAITIPPGEVGPFTLAFDHYVSLEWGWDGGNVKYSINGGTWTTVPTSAFSHNPYNATLASVANGSDNPMRGQPAFTASDPGSVSGTWGQSRVNLTALGLSAGQTITFRWELGSDCRGGWDGWYIDDVRVYTCTLPAVHFASMSSTVNEGEADTENGCLPYKDVAIPVVIDKAPSQPVTVTLKTATGTATQGPTADYTIQSPATFNLAAGNLSQDIIVRVYNDGSLEEDETVILGYTINANGGDAFIGEANQTHTLTIVSDDREPGEIVVTAYTADFNDDFQGWIRYDGPLAGSSHEWRRTTGTSSLNGTHYIIADSDAAGQQLIDEIIESPSFNTTGMTGIQLSFLQFFRVYNAGYNEQAIVEVFDGEEWRTVDTQSQSTGESGSWTSPVTKSINIPDEYANPAMKIRFRYVASWDYWWAIDDVSVIGTRLNGVQSVVSATPATQYLGPDATVYFYDPLSGDVMAGIRNLTSHDYGCTTVEVDRSGAGSLPWVQGYNASGKTLKVIPSNPNPDGEYEITLYYTTAELGSFASAIRSIGKSGGSISTPSPNSSWAEFDRESIYYDDHAFTATFDSGFSGFGLSDAPPDGALPVSLVSFTGFNTTEGNLIQWSTSEEANNDYFVLQRAGERLDFRDVARVKGKGNSVSLNRYSYLDADWGASVAYYRLKQVDFDGQQSLSPIISLSREGGQISVHPNPVVSDLTVRLPDWGSPAAYTIKVFAMTGQVVRENSSREWTRGADALVNLSGLPAGLYQVEVGNGEMLQRFKVIKQ